MKTSIKLPLALALTVACSLPALAVQVTFQVNMSVQIALASFDPANDRVFVAGDFNNWSASASELTPSADPNVYTGTFEVGAVGNWVNYKFIKNRSGTAYWENDGVGGNGAKNRYFQITGPGQILPVVYFNNITDVAVNYAPVTFQVDMSVQIAQGSFDPASGTLTVGGDAINNWSATQSPLAQSGTDPNLWVGTFTVTNPVGSTVGYKFVMNGVWETINDRTFIMTNKAQTLPKVYFNNVTNTATPIPLTFEVNMGVAMARGTFAPDQGDTVEARGSFLTSPGGNWLGGFALTNDPANPVIFRGTIVDTNDAAGSTLQYQFVINGSTWETTGNRLFVLPNTDPRTLPLAYFNNVRDLGPLSITQAGAGQFSVTWTSGPLVRLQSSTNLLNWVDVPDTMGQGSASITGTLPMMFFHLFGP